MKFLDSSKISSIMRIEQIALRKSSNSKYIQHFSRKKEKMSFLTFKRPPVRDG